MSCSICRTTRLIHKAKANRNRREQTWSRAGHTHEPFRHSNLAGFHCRLGPRHRYVQSRNRREM